MTAFSDFYPAIIPDMPGCPEVGIDFELARVSNEFCAETWVYRVDIEEFVISGDESVSPMLPSGTQLVGVVSAQKDGRQIYDFTIDGNDIVFDEVATGGYDFDLTIALKKPMTATDVPDILYRNHLDTIVAGVKSRLFLSPKKSWSDPALADYYGRIYRAELSRYAIKAFSDAQPGNALSSGGRFV
jgi:hypothetical protein